MVELLLAHKANVNAKGDAGYTPLHSAAVGNRKEVAELLLANMADVNARDTNGDTPLHCVCSMDMAKLLLVSKADVNAKNQQGDTPLHGGLPPKKRTGTAQRIGLCVSARVCFPDIHPLKIARSRNFLQIP